MSCLICLEGDPDTGPPCQSVQTLMFHSSCLRMASHNEEAVKCPHCNLRVKRSETDQQGEARESGLNLARHRARSILEQWFQNKAFWVQRPEFIQIKKNGLLTAEENLVMLLGLQMEIVYLFRDMTSSQFPPPVIHALYDDDRSLWVCCCIDLLLNIKITVSLARTAIVDPLLGIFLKDGYTMTAERKRHVPPRLKKQRLSASTCLFMS